MGLFLVILVLECLLSFVSPDAEGDALVALKGSLNDTANQLRDWNPNQVNPCTWPKVICDTNSNVITVSLSNMNFTGTLTPKLGILKSLTTLSHFILEEYDDPIPVYELSYESYFPPDQSYCGRYVKVIEKLGFFYQ